MVYIRIMDNVIELDNRTIPIRRILEVSHVQTPNWLEVLLRLVEHKAYFTIRIDGDKDHYMAKYNTIEYAEGDRCRLIAAMDAINKGD